MGHTVAQCKNPVLKNAFCYYCTQRGHLYLEYPERKSGGKPDSGKPTARVYAIQYEEDPTVDTFAGVVSIASHRAYTLVDTGATHSCMFEEFMNACGLSADVVSGFQLCVSTLIGPSSLFSQVLKSVEVFIGDVSMLVDMLVLPM